VFIPISRGEKAPKGKSWEKITFEETQTEAYQKKLVWCAEHGNIGVRQGETVQSIDIDDDELVEQFQELNPFLANTTVTRAKRGCQFHVRIKGAYPNGQAVYKLAHKFKVGRDGKPLKLMEWRCGGGGKGSQSIISGVHPDKMPYQCNEKRVQELEFNQITWPDCLRLPWIEEEKQPKTESTRVRKGSERLAKEAEERPVKFEDFYAYMPMHNYFFIPTRDPWPASSVNARLPAVKVGVDERGNDILISASAWLDRNRPVEQMTWAPGFPILIENRLISGGGFIDHPGCNTFNQYRPPEIELGNADKAGKWLDHVALLYPDDSDHIVDYCAHRVQKPWQKINHALVLIGAQGIGKDTLLHPVKQAVGPWNVHEILPPTLLGRFNGFVKSVILCINEVHDLGDINRYNLYERLKAYTAAPPDVIRVDEKNVREYPVFNVCGVILTSNFKTGGLYLPADDRRHYVAWSNKKKDDFDAKYWRDIYVWFNLGGCRHVAAYLTRRDISSFNPKAPPKKTDAFWEIVESNRAPENAELSDALDQLEWPNVVTIDDIADLAFITAGALISGEFAAWLKDRRNARTIPFRFEECGYVAVRNPDDKTDGRWRIGNRRCVIYAKRELSIRDQIIAVRKRIAKERT